MRATTILFVALALLAVPALSGPALLGPVAGPAFGQDADPVPPPEPVEVPGEEERHRAFEEMLRGVTLRGHFTMDGRDRPPAEEAYTILGVRKLDEGDFWLFRTRIRYGERDLTLPLPLEVKWAGGTPVITLDDLTIPGLGTFSARVLLHDDRYAGTWQHGDVGGTLFGRIEREAP